MSWLVGAASQPVQCYPSTVLNVKLLSVSVAITLSAIPYLTASSCFSGFGNTSPGIIYPQLIIREHHRTAYMKMAMKWELDKLVSEFTCR